MEHNDLRLDQEIITATKDVFSTMIMMDLVNDTPIIGKGGEIVSNLSSMLGLGGGIRGVLAIHCPTQVAEGITGEFLGMEISELNDDVKDAIGEIANMIAGNLKIYFAGKGIDVKLAIPTSVIGESYHISGLFGANRIVIPFTNQKGPFWIELKYIATN